MLNNPIERQTFSFQDTQPPNANQFESYLSPKLEIRDLASPGGKGVFAREFVQAGELLCIFSGLLISSQELLHLPPERKKKSLQVAEDAYLMSVRLDEPADYINHACNPNAGLDGEIVLRALRDILLDEQVCYDYAMSDGSAYDEFACACGAPNCRGHVTGDDWQQADLQIRYRGWFSPYLQRRIDQQQATEAQAATSAVDLASYKAQATIEEAGMGLLNQATGL